MRLDPTGVENQLLLQAVQLIEMGSGKLGRIGVAEKHRQLVEAAAIMRIGDLEIELAIVADPGVLIVDDHFEASENGFDPVFVRNYFHCTPGYASLRA